MELRVRSRMRCGEVDECDNFGRSMEGMWRNAAGIRGLDIANVRASLGLAPGAVVTQVYLCADACAPV